MAAGYLDLPVERRDQILSIFMTFDRGRSKKAKLHISFKSHGAKGKLKKRFRHAFRWLHHVSLVSKAFALDARRHFFRTFSFVVHDVELAYLRLSWGLPGLRGFLSWLRPEDVWHVKHVDVRSKMEASMWEYGALYSMPFLRVHGRWDWDIELKISPRPWRDVWYKIGDDGRWQLEKERSCAYWSDNPPRDYAWEEVDTDSEDWDSDDYERRVAEYHISDNPWELCRVS